jgi:hypothetical protein
MKKKNRGCRTITGIDLGNSLLNIAGSQNVFHGAVPPGGFEHAERMTSKLIEWSIEPVQEITKNPDCALAQSKQQTVGNRHLHPVRRPQSSFLEHQSS